MIILAGICTGDNIWLPIKSAITIICPPITIFKANCLPNDCFHCHFLMSCGITIPMNPMMPTYATFIAVIIEATHNAIYVIN